MGIFFGNQFFKKLLQNTSQLLLLRQPLRNIRNHFFILFHLPNTIAAHDDKIYVLIFYFFYIWVGCDHLCLGRQLAI